jgi:hypothetical protein
MIIGESKPHINRLIILDPDQIPLADNFLAKYSDIISPELEKSLDVESQMPGGQSTGHLYSQIQSLSREFAHDWEIYSQSCPCERDCLELGLLTQLHVNTDHITIPKHG